VRTTLKRGIGRGAGLDGNGNGHATLPPGALTPMARYRQPDSRPGSSIARRMGKFLFWVAVLALMLAGGAAGGLYLYGHDFASATAPHSAAMKRAAAKLDYVSPDKPAVALVVGSDHRFVDGKDPGRSDTLMLIRTDPSTHTVSMLSFPRDLNVPIYCPGHSSFMAKINAAYATCGPSGPLETVKHLTNVPINYLIAVNFVGFIQVVNRLGGVYIDVDRKYFNNHTGPTGYAAINLQAGYQRLNGKQALDYVRYRHTDSDFFRVARQQLFVRAAKEQMSGFSRFHIFSLLKSIKHNVEIGRSGGNGVSFSTMVNYALFLHGLPGGHFVQVKIPGIVGQNDLTTAPQNISYAINQFMNPDAAAPAKANAAALNEKYKPKVTGINPKSIFITVLNGNGVTGSAAVSGSQLHSHGYQLLQPPAALRADSPDGWNHERTRIFYDPALPKAKAAAKQVAKLFTDASTGPLTPRFRPYANGATLVVVVGKSYTGTLAGTSASTPVPKHQSPHTMQYPGATRSLIRAVRHQVPFRVQYPTVIDRSSHVDPEPPNPRVYSISGHKAVRLVFSTGVPGQFWGVEETNWNNAPILAEKNFHRHFAKRTFVFYYSGSNLRMIVLKQFGATYWIVNTLDNALSNETMIAIARGLRPLS
jgi:LCP family protein required for cell wall assembly